PLERRRAARPSALPARRQRQVIHPAGRHSPRRPGGTTIMRIAIAGASGRMGHMLIQAVIESQDLTLTVALDRAGADAIGQDAGAFLGVDTGVRITDDLDALAAADCLIDFTRPEGTLAHLQACI